MAIVTGGCTPTGRDVARGLAAWGWAIVVVYLEDQREAEATATEIVAAGGTTVAVRADLADDLDVERLFTESIAAFGGVDVVVHTTTAGVGLLYEQAARHVRTSGAILSLSTPAQMTPGVGRRLRERDITVGRAPPDAVLEFLDQWRRQPLEGLRLS